MSVEFKGYKTNLIVFVGDEPHTIDFDGQHGLFTHADWEDSLNEEGWFNILDIDEKKAILQELQIYCGFKEK